MAKAFEKFSKDEADRIRKRFKTLAAICLVFLSLGTLVIHYLEDLSWFDAFYFSIISLTTVGYGDITPQTTGGKVFVIVFLVFGIGLVAATANTMLQNILLRRQEHDK